MSTLNKLKPAMAPKMGPSEYTQAKGIAALPHPAIAATIRGPRSRAGLIRQPVSGPTTQMSAETTAPTIIGAKPGAMPASLSKTTLTEKARMAAAQASAMKAPSAEVRARLGWPAKAPAKVLALPTLPRTTPDAS